MADEPVIPNEEQEDPEVIEIAVAGSTFKGTKDEVIEKLTRSVEHGNTTIKAQRDAHADLARTVAELKAPTPVANGSFDKDKYFETLAKDPVAAQDYLDEVRYGASRQQLQQVWHESSVAAQSHREGQAVTRFMAAADDWPNTPEASEALSDHIKSRGLSITAENLSLAYGELKASGAIKPAVEDPPEERTRRTPNPSARGGGGGGNGTGKRPEDLSTEQLRALINKQGMSRQ